MDNYDSLPDLRMTALVILMQTRWSCLAANKSNDFIVKEALAGFASILEDGDIGYFYDPKSPKALYTNPGGLVGKIANTDLPYGFNFCQAIDHFTLMLNSIDGVDYNKIGIVVSDCLTKTEAEELIEKSSELDANIYIFGIGGCTKAEGVIPLKDALELESALKQIA